MEKRFYVMCSVSGGRTGSREGKLKGLDGEVKRFDTFGEADAEATRLRKDMNGPNARASFNYWPMPPQRKE